MAVQLTDFVKVQITRDPVINTGKSKTVAYLSNIVKPDVNKKGKDLVYYTLAEIENAKDEDKVDLYGKNTDVYKACKVFFECGGKSILLVPVQISLTASTDSRAKYIDAINGLPMDVLAFTTKIGTTTGDNENYNGGLLNVDRSHIIKELDRIEREEGTAFRKLLALDIPLKSDVETQGASINVMYKYVKSDMGKIDEAYEYSCMSILAYLSRIDLDNPATIADYCFTRETAVPVVDNTEDLEWSEIGKTMNVVLDIFGGIATNFGGNTGGGTDLVEEYMLITIAQDILRTELQLLTTKLKFENASTKVHSALIRTLDLYSNIGFLTQGNYLGEDIIVNKNGVNYLVVSKGEIITGGYLINILPMSSRTPTEIANKSLPEVHFVFNTSKGIRHINNIGRMV